LSLVRRGGSVGARSGLGQERLIPLKASRYLLRTQLRAPLQHILCPRDLPRGAGLRLRLRLFLGTRNTQVAALFGREAAQRGRQPAHQAGPGIFSVVVGLYGLRGGRYLLYDSQFLHHACPRVSGYAHGPVADGGAQPLHPTHGRVEFLQDQPGREVGGCRPLVHVTERYAQRGTVGLCQRGRWYRRVVHIGEAQRPHFLWRGVVDTRQDVRVLVDERIGRIARVRGRCAHDAAQIADRAHLLRGAPYAAIGSLRHDHGGHVFVGLGSGQREPEGAIVHDAYHRRHHATLPGQQSFGDLNGIDKLREEVPGPVTGSLRLAILGHLLARGLQCGTRVAHKGRGIEVWSQMGRNDVRHRPQEHLRHCNPRDVLGQRLGKGQVPSQSAPGTSSAQVRRVLLYLPQRIVHPYRGVAVCLQAARHAFLIGIGRLFAAQGRARRAVQSAAQRCHALQWRAEDEASWGTDQRGECLHPLWRRLGGHIIFGPHRRRYGASRKGLFIRQRARRLSIRRHEQRAGSIPRLCLTAWVQPAAHNAQPLGEDVGQALLRPVRGALHRRQPRSYRATKTIQEGGFGHGLSRPARGGGLWFCDVWWRARSHPRPPGSLPCRFQRR